MSLSSIINESCKYTMVFKKRFAQISWNHHVKKEIKLIGGKHETRLHKHSKLLENQITKKIKEKETQGPDVMF